LGSGILQPISTIFSGFGPKASYATHVNYSLSLN